MKKHTHIILDLDNCIADDAWRIPRINWQKSVHTGRYDDYHSLSGFDEIGNTDLLATQNKIVIFTARPVAYHALTVEWLRRKGVDWKALIMRNNNDHRPSVDLKRQQLKWLIELYDVPKDSIVAAYDDREDVVAMYREEGIAAHVRSIHNVCAYKPVKEIA